MRPCRVPQILQRIIPDRLQIHRALPLPGDMVEIENERVPTRVKMRFETLVLLRFAREQAVVELRAIDIERHLQGAGKFLRPEFDGHGSFTIGVNPARAVTPFKVFRVGDGGEVDAAWRVPTSEIDTWEI